MSTQPPVSRDRRRVLRTVGTTIAAAVAAPSLGIAGQHAGHAPTSAKAPATPRLPVPPSAPPAPSILDAHERATLAAISEQLVPGSSAADVPALLDRVLATESPDVLRRFRNALGAFEREARMRHVSTWLMLTDAQRLTILREAAAQPSSQTRRPGWKPGEPVLSKAPSVPPPPPTLRDDLETLRDSVARAYVSTEAGAKELGWTGVDVFDGLPACTLATAITR